MSRTTHVKQLDGTYDDHPWQHPLIIAICVDCGYHVTAVSLDASNAGVWDHTVAVHLGDYHAEISRA